MSFLNTFVRVLAVAVSILPQSSNAFNITAELGPSLSSNATIIFPGTTAFANATDRDNMQDPPTFAVIIEVATEADVQATVKYATANNISFLATTGLHGGTDTLGQVKEGINIYMRKMNSAIIAEDGTTATFGGGILSVEVRDALWAAGKETTTGACECVSLVGPLLGGGHGYLQGFYGLVSDNLVSARVVLADGNVTTVSATENSDLFWALQGAGHNFGIITSVTSKVYDVPANGWAYVQYIFSHDKVAAVFSLLNEWTANGTTSFPVQFINKNVWARASGIDADNAVMIFNIFYQGVDVVPSNYTTPLLALEPLITAANATEYPGLTVIDSTQTTDAVCTQSDAVNMMFPISFQKYNVAGIVTAFDMFNNFTVNPIYSNSAVLFEQYSNDAVKAVPFNSTAFPHRMDNILITPVVSYPVNASLDASSITFGDDFREVLHQADGSPELHTYVNYSHGDETLEELYGYEDWRQTNLKALKTKYDPLGRFDFYAPITNATVA